MKTVVKECIRCEEEFPATSKHFRKNNQQEDGLDVYCKPCSSEAIKAHYVRYTTKEKRVRGQQGALCPLWSKRCGKCFDASICWRITEFELEDEELPILNRHRKKLQLAAKGE